MRKLTLLFLVVFAIFACGKKTQPISKDSFSLPVPDDNAVNIVDNGVKLKNSSEDYVMFAEKSAYDEKGCLKDFAFLTRLPAGETFLDRNVRQGNKYVYRLSYYDSGYDIFSEKHNSIITYSQPLNIADFKYSVKDAGQTELNIKYPERLEYYELFVNDRKLYKGRKNTVTIDLLDGEVNSVAIVPHDIYGNRGNVFAKKIDLSAGKFISAPQELRSIVGKNFVLLSWNSVKKADKYVVYVRGQDNFIKEAESETNFYKYVNTIEDCMKFGVKASSNQAESEMSVIEVCP